MTHEQCEMLEACFEADGGLSGWEMDFIEDLADKGSAYELSEKQHDKLVQIWERVS